METGNRTRGYPMAKEAITLLLATVFLLTTSGVSLAEFSCTVGPSKGINPFSRTARKKA